VMLAHDWIEEEQTEPDQSVDDWLPSENDPEDAIDLVAIESLFDMINNGRPTTSESMRDAMVVVR